MSEFRTDSRGVRWAAPAVVLLSLLVGAPAAVAAEMTETVLPNGLRVVLRPVDSNPVICTSVLVRAGVAWEPEGMSGASHFLEHLLFNGTETRTQEQLYADVDRIGAYNNATTRADHTLYMLLAPGEHLDRALEIQADMLLHSTLPPDKFEKEKGIVLEEMGRDSNDPSNLSSNFFTRELYAGSPYARPVLGTVDSIKGLEREDVLAYYHDRYRPDRMVLLLAGDFDPDDAMAKIRKYFAAGDDGGDPVAPDVEMPQATEGIPDGVRLVHQKLEAGRTYVKAAFPAPAEGDADAVAFGLMVDALTGGSSALERKLKGGDEPSVFDYGLSHDTTGGRGTLYFSATLTGSRSGPEVVGDALETIVRTVRENGVDPFELGLLREEGLTDDVILAEQVHYYAMFRAPRFLQTSAADLAAEAARREGVGVGSFKPLVERYLLPPRALVAVSGPDVEDGTSSTIDTTEFVAMLDARAAEAESAAASAAAGGFETVVLDNGLTLSVRAVPGEQVFAAHVVARNRSALEPEDRPGMADLVHRLLMRGTLARDANGLDEGLRGIGAKVKFHDDARFPFDDYRTTSAYSFALIEARADNAIPALSLFAEILQTPRFDPQEIDKTVATMQDIAKRKQESSSAIASNLFKNRVAPGHAMARPVAGTVDSLSGVRRDDVERMYGRLFDPQNLILTVRGGGTTESVIRRAKEVFGGPGPGGGFRLIDTMNIKVPTALIDPPPVTAKAERVEETLGKRQSYLRLGSVFDVPSDDWAALSVAALILSDRLAMDLRETQGLAYSIGAGLAQVGAERGLMAVSMGTAPDNLEKAEAEIRRVVGELATTPLEVDELDRVVAARVGRILMRRLPSQNQAMYEGLRLLYGAPTGGNVEHLEAIRAVTPEQAVAAAREYIDLDRWVTVVVR